MRPALQLRGFRRIRLQPGESQTADFALPASKLARYDEANCAFVVDAGDFELLIGGSSADIRVRGEFEIAEP